MPILKPKEYRLLSGDELPAVDDSFAKLIHEKVTELQNKLYGPRFCANCNSVQPVATHVVAGSEFQESEGTVLRAGFTGSYTCQTCHHTIT